MMTCQAKKPRYGFPYGRLDLAKECGAALKLLKESDGQSGRGADSVEGEI